jgi:Flp pilus assembly pilin Flp
VRVNVRTARWAERGVTSVEYALMVTVIVILLVGGVLALFDAVQAKFDRDAGCAATAYKGEGC